MQHSFLDNLPLDTIRKLDAICEEYEKRLLAGESPLLPDVLQGWEGMERTVLLNELISTNQSLPEPRLNLADYLQQLPADEVAIRAAFAEEGVPPQDTPLAVRCPHCHESLQIASDHPFSEITCTSCGSTFSLLGEDTITYQAAALKSVGHFELVSRLGVGSFGTVWKARDIKLDRTVAVKMPRADGLSPEEEEKFLREARAAAQLQHPNIVSVHEVGRDGDTLYIVSDYVQGISLADWLTGQQPTVREAAELCQKIAEALHYAHEQGIVHRDLKPSNILLDGEGEPHIMDFGLARREVGEVTMTVDGQILGTPAYMSPEQAQGEAHTADRRTDVYSLGVILFELLTGERPYRGSAPMLMHQVICDEPPSPCKLNKNVPKDLETITLKCLEKEPEKRYQTGQAVAVELESFLSGRPIKARPVGFVKRSWRWCKRNTHEAVLIAAVVILLTTGSAGSLYYAIKAGTRAREAEDERRRTQVALQDVQEARQLANERLEAETLARQDATAARVEAEENLRKALDAVDSMLTEVGADDLVNVPRMSPVRERLLKRALGFYQNFLRNRTNDSKLLLETGRAARRVSEISYLLGNHEGAMEAASEAISIFQRLEKSFPDSDLYVEEAAKSYFDFGFLNYKLQNVDSFHDRSVAASRKALHRYQQLLDSHPNEARFQHGLAETYAQMGKLMSEVHSEEAELSFEKAIELGEELIQQHPDSALYLRTVGTYYQHFALHFQLLQKPVEAIPYSEQSTELLRRLLSYEPDNAQNRFSLARSFYRLGMVLGNDPDRAEECFREAASSQANLVSNFPDVWDYRWDLTATLEAHGRAIREGGRAEEAKVLFASAAETYAPTIEYREKLANKDASNPILWGWLAQSCLRLADSYEASAQDELLIDTLRKCIGFLNQTRMLVDEEDSFGKASASTSCMLLTTYIRLGKALSSVGYKDEADAQFHLAGKVLLGESEAMEKELDGSRYSSEDLETLIWHLNHFPLPEYRNAKLASRFSGIVSEANSGGSLESTGSGVAAARAE